MNCAREKKYFTRFPEKQSWVEALNVPKTDQSGETFTNQIIHCLTSCYCNRQKLATSSDLSTEIEAAYL